MRHNIQCSVVCGLLFLFMSGCNRYQAIPDHLLGHVNKELTYEQVKTSPAAARGQIVVWGGEVLNAVRDPEKTTVEVLEIPLNKDHIPLDKRASSRGRFLAIDSHGEIIDPAIFKEGSRVTVIGEILELRTETLEQAAYDYPVVAIRDLTVWDEHTTSNYPLAGFHNYYGYGYYGHRPYLFGQGTRVERSDPSK
ncbi:MAG TPA: Slp family lipoprotein [Nitrospira sp.]|nr:Slp family lipoprotein [Nitrospira sp.]